MILVKCPHCNAEYVPSEIYLPKYFLGIPKYIHRNEENKITGITGSDMDLNETYQCDFCGNKFSVKAKVTFSTKEVKSINMDEDYISPMYKSKELLKED